MSEQHQQTEEECPVGEKTNSSTGQSSTSQPRHIFISASALVREYKEVPKEILDRAIFFFGSDRSWIFPETDEEKRDSKRQPTNYLGFPEEFKALILKKEEEGLCFFLKPHRDYRMISSCIQRIPGENYNPLLLDQMWWKEKYDAKKMNGRFCTVGFRVALNIKQGEHDYASTMELLYQSNPEGMIPVLNFKSYYA